VGVSGVGAGSFSSSAPMMTLISSGYSNGTASLVQPLPLFTLDAFGTSYTNRII
jgi:hypothetical protein